MQTRQINVHTLTPHFYILLYSKCKKVCKDQKLTQSEPKSSPKQKTRVYKRIFVSYFCSKTCIVGTHRRTIDLGFSGVPKIYVLSKNKKNITIFHLKIIFYSREKLKYNA